MASGRSGGKMAGKGGGQLVGQNPRARQSVKGAGVLGKGQGNPVAAGAQVGKARAGRNTPINANVGGGNKAMNFPKNFGGGAGGRNGPVALKTVQPKMSFAGNSTGGKRARR